LIQAQPGGRVVRGREQIVDLISRLTAKALLSLGILFVATVVQLLRAGYRPRYLLLLAGSVLSAFALLAFAMLVAHDAGKKKRGLVPMLIGFGGFVPYVFGCYLVFYEGLWRLRALSGGFSLSLLLVSAFFVVLGYAVVSGIHQVSELARRVDEGSIIIDPEGAV